MHTVSRSGCTTVVVEGALHPAESPQRVADGNEPECVQPPVKR
jgi:hypothetical protein